MEYAVRMAVGRGTYLYGRHFSCWCGEDGGLLSGWAEVLLRYAVEGLVEVIDAAWSVFVIWCLRGLRVFHLNGHKNSNMLYSSYDKSTSSKCASCTVLNMSFRSVSLAAKIKVRFDRILRCALFRYSYISFSIVVIFPEFFCGKWALRMYIYHLG